MVINFLLGAKMEKHLFILYGKGNTGKTTTLNLLFKKTCEQFLDNLVYFRRNEGSADFCAIFQKGDVKVGLYSSGDNEWHVSHNLYELNHQYCNFIFGTSRTRGGSRNAVKNYASLFYPEEDVIEWYEKEEANDQDNNKKAKLLFNELKKLLTM